MPVETRRSNGIAGSSSAINKQQHHHNIDDLLQQQRQQSTQQYNANTTTPVASTSAAAQSSSNRTRVTRSSAAVTTALKVDAPQQQQQQQQTLPAQKGKRDRGLQIELQDEEERVNIDKFDSPIQEEFTLEVPDYVAVQNRVWAVCKENNCHPKYFLDENDELIDPATLTIDEVIARVSGAVPDKKSVAPDEVQTDDEEDEEDEQDEENDSDENDDEEDPEHDDEPEVDEGLLQFMEDLSSEDLRSEEEINAIRYEIAELESEIQISKRYKIVDRLGEGKSIS